MNNFNMVEEFFFEAGSKGAAETLELVTIRAMHLNI
jgi:hypothetical protein